MSEAKPMGNPRRLAAYLRQNGIENWTEVGNRLVGLTPRQQRRANRKAWRAQRATLAGT